MQRTYIIQLVTFPVFCYLPISIILQRLQEFALFISGPAHQLRQARGADLDGRGGAGRTLHREGEHRNQTALLRTSGSSVTVHTPFKHSSVLRVALNPSKPLNLMSNLHQNTNGCCTFTSPIYYYQLNSFSSPRNQFTWP